ncbi:hypothetical protein [Alicycliphilus denitrificans]|uniref:hypothetical protein n=1 Tax=Alicycliphilus denitrificans TaxID=179636 RepID=UPI00384BFD50
MTNCTVAAPVRATKAPARKKAVPALPPTKPFQSEGDVLALQVAEMLQTLVMDVVYDHNNGHRGLQNSHLNEVDHLLGRLLAPDYHERNGDDPAEGDILGHLAEIRCELEFALDLLDEREMPGITVPVQVILVNTTRHASDLANRLFLAYRGLPGTIEHLRALTTYRGAKPFRGQPNPPIQRSSHEQEPARKLRAFELRDMAIDAEKLGMLIEWTVTAHGILDSIEFCAQRSPALEKALIENDIRFRCVNWLDCKMDENIVYVLNQQNRIIQQMAGGAA